MKDLIERQAAIDALAKLVPYAICDASTESYTNGLTDAYNLICQLPSAQPEIIRCKECKKWNVYGNRGEGWCDEWKEMLMDICFCSSAKRREASE